MTEQEDSNYHKTWEEVKKYLTLQLEYSKLTAIEKLTIILSAMAVSAVALILGAGVLFYLSFALVHSIEEWIGSTVWAYLLVSLFFAIVLIFVFVLKKRLIIDPIARFLSKLFLDPTK
ncbi:MAG: phage holin family protein [Muribaculaceae bacterium]